MSFWFTASFGDFTPLRISRITTEDGRDIVVQSPSRGNQHFLSDRGAKFGKVDAEIVFVDEPGADDYRNRFNAFRNLIVAGKSLLFSHPLLGAYYATCEGGSHTLDESAKITFSVSFLPDEGPPTVSQIIATPSAAAGAQAVTAALADTTDAFTTLNLTSTVPSDSAAQVASWNTSSILGTLDPQNVIVGVQSLTSNLNDAINDLELATNPQLWSGYVSMINLIYQINLACNALVSTTNRMVPLTVATPTPLLTICARVYGADQAVDMAPIVAQRNRIRTPGLVPAGTVLAMPAAAA